MSNDSERFRRRARECRDIAAQTKDTWWSTMLLELADELEEEAERVEAEER